MCLISSTFKGFFFLFFPVWDRWLSVGFTCDVNQWLGIIPLHTEISLHFRCESMSGNTTYTLEQALVEPVVTTRQNNVSLHRAQRPTRLGGKQTNKKLALIAPPSNGALFHNTTTTVDSTRLRARKKGRK